MASQYLDQHGVASTLRDFRFLSQHSNLDVQLCSNDLVAIDALQACVESGIYVPETLAVMGYDDIPICSVWLDQH